jgi:hypothetical protein
VAIHQAPETRSCRMRVPHLQIFLKMLSRNPGSSNRHAALFSFERDPFGKPVSTFPDHA